MRRRIIIGIVALAIIAAVFIPLYLLVFKGNNLSQADASSLIIKSATYSGIIEDDENLPDIDLSKFNTGNGDKNLINSTELPSMTNILASLSKSSGYDESLEEFEYVVSICVNFMKLENLRQNRVFQLIIEEDIIKVVYRIIGNEVLFTVYNDTTDSYSYISFFYDSSDNEFEYIYIQDLSTETLFNCSFSRYKFNQNGMISYEKYELTGVENEDISEAIQHMTSGSSSISIIDYIEGETHTYLGSNSDSHFVVSNYIYRVYLNFSNGLEKSVELIDSTNELSEPQATSLVINSAIKIGAMSTYRGVPRIDLSIFYTGNGNNNIINSEDLATVITFSSVTFNNSTGNLKPVLSLCATLMRRNDLEQGEEYELEIGENTYKISYKIIKHEIVFTIFEAGKYSFASLYYDSSEGEFEFVYIEENLIDPTFYGLSIYRFDFDGMISYENYSVSKVEIEIESEDPEEEIEVEYEDQITIIRTDFLEEKTEKYISSSGDVATVELVKSYMGAIYSTFLGYITE